MKKLFQEFEGVKNEAWVEKLYADLKGKSEDMLTYSPELDLKVKSFYHRSEALTGSYPIGKATPTWSNRKEYKSPTNQHILDELNAGVDHLGLQFEDQVSFNQLTDQVEFQHIGSDISFQKTASAINAEVHESSHLNFDIFGRAITVGTWRFEKSDFLSFVKSHPSNRTVWIEGSIYGESGASSIQELAFTANHLNEYVQLLTNEGISLADINAKLIVEISVTDDYFVNISKLKSLRYLIDLVFSGYDKDYKVKEIPIYAKTSSRYLAINDSNNNYLRQTTQAMSALIGGCDVITVTPSTSDDLTAQKELERLSKNIPLILKEEAYLDKVTDAAEGSYYVEALIEQLLDKAWAQFKEIEQLGGLCAAIEANHIQSSIEKNRAHLIEKINSKEKTFLGVNKYPSSTEDWKKPTPQEKITGDIFQALQPFRIEEYYQKELHEQS